MAAPFTVRVFGYAGMVQVQAKNLTQLNSDSVFLLDEPYMWSALIALTDATAKEMPVQAGDKANIIRIEVPDDQAIRFEINPHGPGLAASRVASTNSPKLTGADQFPWYQGATVSVIDASGLP